jgi:hypothetical protein
VVVPELVNAIQPLSVAPKVRALQTLRLTAPAMRGDTRAATLLKLILSHLQETRTTLSPVGVTNLEKEIWSIIQKDVPRQEDPMKPVAETIWDLMVQALKHHPGAVRSFDRYIELIDRQVLSAPRIQAKLRQLRRDFIASHSRVLDTGRFLAILKGDNSINGGQIFRKRRLEDERALGVGFDTLQRKLLEGFYSHFSNHTNGSRSFAFNKEHAVRHALGRVHAFHGRWDVDAIKQGQVPLMRDVQSAA